MSPPSTPESLADAAADALEAGRPEVALAHADEALRGVPRLLPALHCRAAALADLGRLDEAREAYARALSAGRDDLDLLFGAAEFHVSLAQEDEPDRALIEEGLGLARRGAKLARKAGDAEREGEFRWLEGVGLNQLGEPEAALAALARAEEALPDAVDVLVERAFALYELCRFGEARAVLERAERLDPEDSWTQHLLGLVAERQGDEAEARRRLKRARRLDPEGFPEPVALSHAAFEAAVEDALERIPPQVRDYLANVAITVEDVPPEDDLLASDPPLSPSILGLFRGAPWGRKASADPWSHLPSGIVLYQRNLERFARSRAELIEQIGVTLVHEVGHFLGLDEDELWERGLD
jgi:predicted Zn-dependent protease with MMP-like domain/Flp pilus assembly protein TadD